MLTLRLKVKAESYNWLNVAAIEVNQVWNFCNEQSSSVLGNLGKRLSGYELCYRTAGSSKYMKKIGANTIQCVCVEYAAKCKKVRKRALKWRSSYGAKRSLGWVPFKAADLKVRNKALRFAGKTFRVFEFEKLDGANWKQSCFAQDAIGDWWLCLSVEKSVTNDVAPREMVGIDLGLKSTATTSDGDTLEAGRYYRDTEDKISQAQRRGHKKQSKRLHRKAANQRKDALHKFSRKIVNNYQNIVIGNVSSTNLVKTRMAKAVLDSGWGMLKTQLLYKGQQAGRSVEIVNEAFTTRACSECGSLSGPQGLRHLVVREWTCSDCGTEHNRDVNAAKNILALRYQRPSAGTSRELMA